MTGWGWGELSGTWRKSMDFVCNLRDCFRWDPLSGSSQGIPRTHRSLSHPSRSYNSVRPATDSNRFSQIGMIRSTRATSLVSDYHRTYEVRPAINEATRLRAQSVHVLYAHVPFNLNPWDERISSRGRDEEGRNFWPKFIRMEEVIFSYLLGCIPDSWSHSWKWKLRSSALSVSFSDDESSSNVHFEDNFFV